MDEDLDELPREKLLDEARRMRLAIRVHRDSSGHALCWHHPDLWDLLPDKLDARLLVPAWPQFLQGCIHYRQSLDEQAAGAPRIEAAYQSRTG